LYIRIANDSKFGFRAKAYRRNLDKAERLSLKVESGIVTVNNVAVSDPRVSF